MHLLQYIHLYRHHGFINPNNITSLIGSATQNLNTDYTNAYNWYPGLDTNSRNEVEYSLSIPKIGIENAKVNNKDTDLTTHLVQYNADTYPPNQGNTIIFGHSTLPNSTIQMIIKQFLQMHINWKSEMK